MNPQKPLQRAYQLDPDAVKRWKSEEYPEIRKEAKEVGAKIFFGDEAGVRSDYHTGATWAPRGQTPVVKATGARLSMNLISAVSPRGKMRFMTLEGRIDGQMFIRFLKRLLANAEQPIFLIVDRHPAHTSAPVQSFVASTEGRLRLFFLPSILSRAQPG